MVHQSMIGSWGAVALLYGDTLLSVGQDNLRSVCAVALQLRGAQSATVTAAKFLGDCGFATHR